MTTYATVPPAPAGPTTEDERPAHALPSALAAAVDGDPPQFLSPLLEYLEGKFARSEESQKVKLVRLAENIAHLNSLARELQSRVIGLESAVGQISSTPDDLPLQVVQISTALDALNERVLQLSRVTPTLEGALYAPNVQTQAAGAEAAPVHKEAARAGAARAHQQGAVPMTTAELTSQFPPLSTNFGRNPPPQYRVPGIPVPSGINPLVTIADSSAPLPRVNESTGPFLGPYAPGLEPIQTMLTPFEKVLDYRHYRLRDLNPVPDNEALRKMYRLKKQIDGLYTTLGSFDGADPIELLNFLATFKEACDALATSEAIGVRVLAYFLKDDAKDTYQQQTSPGTNIPGRELEASWPFVINALLRRFLSDDVLQEAYDGVSRAVQREKEDETAFATRVMDASRVCRHVFTPSELVNAYVRGLHEATRERIYEQVRHLPAKDRTNIVVIRQMASAEGRAQRAQVLRATTATTNTRSGRPLKPSATATMLLDDDKTPAPVSPPTTPTSSATYETPTAHPMAYVNAVLAMEDLFVLDEDLVMKTIQGMKMDGREVMRSSATIPELTPDQVEQAMAAIPTEFWYMQCRICYNAGHSMYTCPMLTVAQRVYFAYRYYLHQVGMSASLSEWLQQKRLAMKGQGPYPGRRPLLPAPPRRPGPPEVPPATPGQPEPPGRIVQRPQPRSGVNFVDPLPRDGSSSSNTEGEGNG